MVDAKGKTVGRFYPPPALLLFSGGGTPVATSYFSQVVRQINGIWVSLTVDAQTGFLTR
jgi:hypothetical protein